MSDKDTGSKTTKTLGDEDISTYARRGGPSGGSAGTDADAHTDSDAVATDHDQAPAAHSDADAHAGTDKD